MTCDCVFGFAEELFELVELSEVPLDKEIFKVVSPPLNITFPCIWGGGGGGLLVHHNVVECQFPIFWDNGVLGVDIL